MESSVSEPWRGMVIDLSIWFEFWRRRVPSWSVKVVSVGCKYVGSTFRSRIVLLDVVMEV